MTRILHRFSSKFDQFVDRNLIKFGNAKIDRNSNDSLQILNTDLKPATCWKYRACQQKQGSGHFRGLSIFDRISNRSWSNYCRILIKFSWNFDRNLIKFWSIEFWSNFDRISTEFWSNFGRILVELRSKFDRNSIEFGSSKPWSNFDRILIEFGSLIQGRGRPEGQGPYPNLDLDFLTFLLCFNE